MRTWHRSIRSERLRFRPRLCAGGTQSIRARCWSNDVTVRSDIPYVVRKIIRLAFLCRPLSEVGLRTRPRRCEVILVMQASHDRFREHERTRRQAMSGFSLREYYRCSRRVRHTRAQRAMRTAFVVMGNPFLENHTKMRLGDRNEPIQTLPPYRPDHAFANRIRFRTRHWRSQHFYTQRARTACTTERHRRAYRELHAPSATCISCQIQ
jgi:hypothetical protein